MGYCIMRNEKIKTMSHCIGLENEHNRASSEENLYKERFSPNIDWKKTDENIYLVKKNNWKRIKSSLNRTMVDDFPLTRTVRACDFQILEHFLPLGQVRSFYENLKLYDFWNKITVSSKS